MRISDWSSDVCSSDLTKLGDVRVFTRLDNVLRSITAAPRGHYVEGEWQLDDAVRFDVATGREQRLGSIRIAPEVRPDQFTLSKVEIGRASCRERVCQYV